jgi:hypothetical protein
MSYQMRVEVDSPLDAEAVAHYVRERSRSSKRPYSAVRQAISAAAAGPVWWKEKKTSRVQYARVQRRTPKGLVLRSPTLTVEPAESSLWYNPDLEVRDGPLVTRPQRIWQGTTYAKSSNASWMDNVSRPRANALGRAYSRDGLDLQGQIRMRNLSESMGARHSEFSSPGQG